MNKIRIRGNWTIIKGKFKQQWAKLSGDGQRYEDGQQVELVGRIQKRTGQTREEVESAIKSIDATQNKH